MNFWATWCPSCLGEIPDLVALQEQHRDTLTILGVSLDLVPDEHGHIGGHSSARVATQRDGDQADHASHRPGASLRERVRAKVARTVQARGINYTVLLDETNEVGGRFNGGELPTTVILDAGGVLRRRFVGPRGLAVLEAMIAELCSRVAHVECSRED